MPKDGLYRAVVFGPTGSGKSQFCNFSQRDLENNIINEIFGIKKNEKLIKRNWRK